MEEEHTSKYFAWTYRITRVHIALYLLFLTCVWSLAWLTSRLFGFDGSSLSSYFYIFLIIVLRITSIPLAVLGFVFTVWLWTKIYHYCKKFNQCCCDVYCRGIEEEVVEYRQTRVQQPETDVSIKKKKRKKKK